MKGFKKLALVAAIAAPFTSVHALEAISDADLSGMTGQAGVTIELDTKVTMDSFTYTDTDTNGSVVMSNIAFGGASVATSSTAAWNEGDRFDEVKIDIDVLESGSLLIHLGSIDTAGVLTDTNPLDFGLSVGSFGLTGTNGTSVIASNIALAGTLGPQDIVIANNGANGLIQAQGYFEIKDGGMNIDVAGVGVSNLTIGQNSNPFADGNGKLVDYTDSDKVAALTGGATRDASQVGTGDDNWAFYAVTINTADSADGTVTNALAFTVDSFNVDIAMEVGIGNGSVNNIGRIAMENLDVSGTKMVVYGH